MRLGIFLLDVARQSCFAQQLELLLPVMDLACRYTVFTARLCYAIALCFLQNRKLGFLAPTSVGSHRLLP